MITSIFTILLCCSAYSQDRNRHEFYGISLGLHSKDLKFDYSPMVSEIASTGANSIGLTIIFYQENIEANTIEIPATDSPYWKQLRQTIHAANAHGLRVFLSPILQLKNGRQEDWRGKINPQNKSMWFESYSSLISQIARLAESENVELLSIGSELSALQTSKSEWKGIIDQVRLLYSGTVCYSINWDALHSVSFLEDLDLLGVSAYFPLSEYRKPSRRRLVNSWRQIKNQLEATSKSHAIPYFISELGYRSVNGSNQTPWDHDVQETKLDIEEQYDCYYGFVNAYKEDNFSRGVFFYDWFGTGGMQDTSYTPKGKPSLELIEQFFAERQKKK